MAQRDQIIAYLDDLLEIDAFADYGPNGLQVPGAEEVSRVVTGVSAQRELFEQAAAANAELGLERAEPFDEHKGRTIGFVGRSADGIPFGELRERCVAAFEQEPFVWECGPELVRSVAIVSGGAPGSFRRAIDHGVDAFLTGEPAEHVMADARENGVHF